MLISKPFGSLLYSQTENNALHTADTQWVSGEWRNIASSNGESSRASHSYDIMKVHEETIASAFPPLSINLIFAQFSSVPQSCPTLCDPMNCSMPGLPAHHQLPESTQTHVHRVSDAIQPSHPLSSPSPPAPNLSQHHGLFKWVSSSHQVAKVLEFQLQHQSFQWTPRTQNWSPLEWTGWISVQSKRLSRVSNTTVQKHQFFGPQLSL